MALYRDGAYYDRSESYPSLERRPSSDANFPFQFDGLVANLLAQSGQIIIILTNGRSNRLDEPFDDAELVCRKEPSGQKAFWTQYNNNMGLPCLKLRPYHSCLTSNILADQLA